jgi:hypothetical protein
MKTWRVMSLLAFGVLMFAFAVPLAAASGIPGSTITWRPLLLFLIPPLVIVVLLPLRQRLEHTRYRITLAAAAVLIVSLAVSRLIAAFVAAIVLIALAAMFLASRALRVGDRA